MNLSPIDAHIVQLIIKSLAFAASASLMLMLLAPFLSARSQSLGWRMVMLTTLVMPVLVWVLPSIPLLERETRAVPVVESVTVVNEMLAPVATVSVVDAPVLANDVHSTSYKPTSAPAIAAASDEPVTWLVWVCLAVALVMVARLILGHVSVWKLCRTAKPSQSEFASALLPKSVTVWVCDDSRLPMTCGLLRPKIILPEEFEQWDTETLRAVLLHEMSHIERRDLWFLFLSNITTALHWPNPFAWLAARKLRLVDERAADDAVLARGMDAGGYSRLLYEMATGCGGTGRCPVVQYMARRSTVGMRIRCLLNPRQIRRAPGFASLSGFTLGALAIGCFVGMVTVTEVVAGPDQDTPIDEPQKANESAGDTKVPTELKLVYENVNNDELAEVLYWLPETSDIITGKIPNYNGEWTQFERSEWEKVPVDKRLRIVEDLESKLQQMDGAKQKATLQRIRDWRQLRNQISSLTSLEGVERFLTIAFEDPLLKPVFDSHVKRMEALKPGIFEEIEIGENLSSSQTAYYPNIIVLRLLDSPEKERLECISRLYAKFAERKAATDK